MMNQVQGVGHTFQNLTRNLLGGALLLALGLALGIANVHAATTDVWIAGTGTFGTAANWDTGVAPVDADSVLFTNNTSYTVNFGANSPLLVDCTFSGHVGSVSLNMGGNILYATNRVLVGRYDSTSTVYMVSGTLYNS